jgi:hypothetical protein
MCLLSDRFTRIIIWGSIASFIFTASVNAQAPVKSNQKQRLTKNQQLTKSTVDNFLQTWLVKKKINKSLRFFHPKAFENKLLLKDSWLGDSWGTNGKKGVHRVRKVVYRVLSEISANAGKAELENLLSNEHWKDDEQKILQSDYVSNKSILLSNLKKDQYILVQSSDFKKIAQDKSDWLYLVTKYPSTQYAGCIINVYPKERKDKSEMIMYFLWAKTAGKWQIILFGVFGM